MQDLTLDFDKKIIINSYLTKKNLIMQKVVLALQCWSGDWFLDGDFGIPYDIRANNKSLLTADIQDIIMSVDGVNGIKNLDIKSRVQDGKRTIYINAFIITTEDEIIEFNGLVPILGV